MTGLGKSLYAALPQVMKPITYEGKTPEIGEGCFIAPTAAVIGDVVIGKDSSVWYGASVRADGNGIRIGDRVSVQDGVSIHITSRPGGSVSIGSDVVIGHNATVHSCTVGNHCLIGMGSTVLDGACVGDGSIVAGGALVLGGTRIGPNEMWAGVPAKFVKNVTPESVARTIDEGVEEYVRLARIYAGMEE